MDWIARKKDWRQFYRFKDQLGLGTAYYSELLLDEELAAQAIEKRSPRNPPLRGYTPLLHRLTDIADIMLKHAVAQGGGDPNRVDGIPRPLTARDKIRDRRRQQKLDRIVAKAMGRALTRGGE